MKHPDIKWSPYIDSSKEINAKDPKFKIGDIVRISKHKYIFANGLKFLWFRKLKILCYGPMLLMILIEKKLLEHFTKKNWKKTNQEEFRTEKEIKRKGNELYVKFKEYNNLFNS